MKNNNQFYVKNLPYQIAYKESLIFCSVCKMCAVQHFSFRKLCSQRSGPVVGVDKSLNNKNVISGITPARVMNL